MWILDYTIGSDTDKILTRKFNNAYDMMTFIADTKLITVIKIH